MDPSKRRGLLIDLGMAEDLREAGGEAFTQPAMTVSKWLFFIIRTHALL
jgi:hypothetical protein